MTEVEVALQDAQQALHKYEANGTPLTAFYTPPAKAVLPDGSLASAVRSPAYFATDAPKPSICDAELCGVIALASSRLANADEARQPTSPELVAPCTAGSARGDIFAGGMPNTVGAAKESGNNMKSLDRSEASGGTAVLAPVAAAVSAPIPEDNGAECDLHELLVSDRAMPAQTMDASIEKVTTNGPHSNSTSFVSLDACKKGVAQTPGGGNACLAAPLSSALELSPALVATVDGEQHHTLDKACAGASAAPPTDDPAIANTSPAATVLVAPADTSTVKHTEGADHAQPSAISGDLSAVGCLHRSYSDGLQMFLLSDPGPQPLAGGASQQDGPDLGQNEAASAAAIQGVSASPVGTSTSTGNFTLVEAAPEASEILSSICHDGSGTLLSAGPEADTSVAGSTQLFALKSSSQTCSARDHGEAALASLDVAGLGTDRGWGVPLLLGGTMHACFAGVGTPATPWPIPAHPELHPVQSNDKLSSKLCLTDAKAGQQLAQTNSQQVTPYPSIDTALASKACTVAATPAAASAYAWQAGTPFTPMDEGQLFGGFSGINRDICSSVDHAAADGLIASPVAAVQNSKPSRQACMLAFSSSQLAPKETLVDAGTQMTPDGGPAQPPPAAKEACLAIFESG